MALISLYNQDMEKAVQYFEKELQVAQRRSSLAQLVKSGKRDRINLSVLRKRKMQHDGTDNRNFFSEIALGKFEIPAPPEKCADSELWRAKTAGFRKSVQEEFLFWSNAGTATMEQLKAEGKQYPGLYADLVNELIRDLGDKYIPLLKIIDEDDVPFLTQLQYDHAAKDKATPCPQPPMDAENFAVLARAYKKKCCDLKTPLIDELMNRHNSFVWARIAEAQAAYKEYINGLVSSVQLNPGPANNRMVYRTVAGYFTFIINAMGSYLVLGRPMGCHDDITTEASDAIIASNRNFKVECPEWLKLQVKVKVATLKADCNAFNIEAGIYGLIHAGAEKSFKTGNSTLYAGAGIEGKFKDVAEGDIKQQFYIVFDNNNEFADLGMRGSAGGELAGGVIGAEFGYDFAMNSGFDAQGKVKSSMIEKFEKVLSVVQ